MFCLRVWLLPLFFLSSAPPLYLLLFLSATYVLQRPCLYCSLLLAVLVLALFDFNANWFEPRSAMTSSSSSSPPPPLSATNDTSLYRNTVAAHDGNSSAALVQDMLADGAALLASAVNATAGMLVDAAAMARKQEHSTTAGAAALGGWRQGWLRWGGDVWARSFWVRREVRIPCVNAVIRL